MAFPPRDPPHKRTFDWPSTRVVSAQDPYYDEDWPGGPHDPIKVTKYRDNERSVVRYTEHNRKTGEKRCIEIDDHEVMHRKEMGLPDNPFSDPRENPRGWAKEQHDDKADAVSAASWNPKKSQAYEKNMANKFLPFIVETSSPVHIFKTLLSRSKGMSKNLVVSVLYMVLLTDLSKLRAIVKELPDMSLEQLYEELLIKFPHCRVEEEHIQMFLTICKWFPKEGDLWIDELNIFQREDVMLFFLAISLSPFDLAAYTNAPLKSLVTHFAEDALADVAAYVHFADNGEQVAFDNELDFKSFVLYQALLAGAMEPDAPKRTFNAGFKGGAEL